MLAVVAIAEEEEEEEATGAAGWLATRSSDLRVSLPRLRPIDGNT